MPSGDYHHSRYAWQTALVSKSGIYIESPARITDRRMIPRPALGNRHPAQRFRTFVFVTLPSSFSAAEWRQTLPDHNPNRYE